MTGIIVAILVYAGLCWSLAGFTGTAKNVFYILLVPFFILLILISYPFVPKNERERILNGGKPYK